MVSTNLIFLSKMQAVKLLILCVLLLQCSGKYIEETIPHQKIISNPHLYLGKVAADKNIRVNIWSYPTITLDYDLKIPLTIGVFRYDNFERVVQNQFLTCGEKLRRADYLIPLVVDFNRKEKVHYGMNSDLGIFKENEHDLLYFVLFDCDGLVRKESNFYWYLRIEMMFSDQNESHLSPLERWIFYFKFGALLFIAIIFGWYYKPTMIELKKEHFEKNYAFIWLFVAACFKLFSLLLDVFECWLISRGGHDWIILNFFAKSTDMASNYIVMLIILYIASGWTIFFSRLDDMEFFLPLTIALGIMKLIIFGIVTAVRIEQNHFHAFGGIMGGIVTVLHVGLFFYFVILLDSNSLKVENNEQMKEFYYSLAALAFVYLLAFPFWFIISMFLNPVYQAGLIEFGNTSCQLLALLFMGLLVGTNGKYGQVANLDFSLPSSGKERIN